MRATVLTTFLPPETDHDRNGMHRRVSATLRALASRVDHIDMLHIPAPIRQTDSLRQSAFWGQPIHTQTLTRHEGQPSFWNDNIRGLADLAHQHPWHRYAGPGLLRQLQDHLDTRPSLIIVDRLEPMIALRRCHTTAPILLDLNDIEHKMEREALRQRPLTLHTALAWAKWPAVLHEERMAARRASRAAVCSNTDAAYLRRRHFPGTIVTIPNAIALPQHAPGLGTRPTVMLLGTYGYPPNAVAAHRLVTRIWPLIAAQAPDARLILAGPGSETLPARLTAPSSVEFRGYVPDLAALYAETRIVCCPLTEGGGTRLKLIEAAAYARPIVSTAKGAEGLDLTNGQDILIAETDTALANACVSLLADPAQCLRLGTAARAAAAPYDLDAVIAHIGTILDDMLAQT